MNAEKMAEIYRRIVPLMALQANIERHTAYHPEAVMLPSRLDPGEYDGPGARPGEPPRLLGLPVVWGDRTALLYEVDVP